jgi:pimeloyl-ACP methyl ester carboxylesterase
MVRRNHISLLANLFVPCAVLSALLATPQFAGAQKAEEEALPEPVEEKLEAIDGPMKLVMHCTYYPSLLGKDAIPVLLLHGKGGARGDYDFLAQYLQKQGHAVLVPDLRGHGDSNEIVIAGVREKILPDKMKKAGLNAIVKDLEAVKSFLVQKNNAEELNVEMLVVVGSDMSSITAVNFALRDWTVPELLAYKNCKDVKAMVLLSPTRVYEGTEMTTALKHPVVGHKLSVLLVEGEKNRAALAETKKIVNLLEGQHGEKSGTKSKEDKEVVFYAEDTNLQGTKLVTPATRVAPIIAQFIQFRVRALADSFPWSKRVKPGDDK